MSIITSIEQLSDLVKEINHVGRCGIDLEFIPEKTYAPVLCLVQIGTKSGAHLIDPLALTDLTLLWDCLKDPAILTVFHAASQDLEIIHCLAGGVPGNIFDTQIAAGFVGLGYPIGYGKLVTRLIGVNLDKTESFTDWLHRPLSAEQIQYAMDDVDYLLPLYDQLSARLGECGRLKWAIDECKQYVENGLYLKDRALDYQRVKGAGNLSRRSLAVLQALCLWRNQEAHHLNKPLRSILSDNVLLELARRPPKELTEIKRVRSIRPDQIRLYGQEIMKAIQNGLALPDQQMPAAPEGRAPSKTDVLLGDTLYALLKIMAYELDLAAEIIATRGEIQALIKLYKSKGKKEDLDLPILQNWRWDAVGVKLWQVLSSHPLSIRCDVTADPPVAIAITPS